MKIIYKTIIFIILILILLYLRKKNIENFIDPRYHILSVYDNKNLYTRFMDYFHYGNMSKYDYPYTLPTYPLNIYDYPMNYIRSPIPIRTTTMYEIQNIKNPNDYNYHILDKYGNLHLLDYRSNPTLLTNQNFNEQVWINPHDKKIIFIPK